MKPFVFLFTVALTATQLSAEPRTRVDHDECAAKGISESECIELSAAAFANMFGPVNPTGCAIFEDAGQRLNCYDEFFRQPENRLWRAHKRDLIDLR